MTDPAHRFVAAVDRLARAIAAHSSGDVARDLDTLAHSILAMIDGVTESCPPLDLVPRPEGGDPEWTDGEVINADVHLHDLLGELWRQR